MTLKMNRMVVTLTPITILMSWNWMTATMLMVNLTSMIGLQISDAILSGVLTELFIFYAHQTNAGKAFIGSSRMETNEIGSLKRLRVVNVIQSKFPCFNF